jgi:ribonuclease Y
LAVLYYTLTFAVGAALGWVAFHLYGLYTKRRAANEAAEVLARGRQEADGIRKEAELRAKEEIFKRREEFEKETQDIRNELKLLEKRLSRREDNLDQKTEALAKRERSVEELEGKIAERDRQVRSQQAELASLVDQEKNALARVAEISREDARTMLLQKLEGEVRHEAAALINRIVEQTKEEAEGKAREIVTLAIQRCAADTTQEATVSTIDIPSDEMKGRIIGREGRNIRAFERETGVDVIVDDTPGVVVISSFDSVRREMARRALEKLIVDGRIHPARIEEVVIEAKKEIEECIAEAGKQAVLDTDVHGLHPKEVQLIGRLRFRTSYGQNVLKHSIEVALLAGIIASELGLDIQLAKRCGLLHDIGKAVDHEVEGGHPSIGADLARRYNERPEVINAIGGHHDDVAPTNPYTIIIASADAISAARPGARGESLERYIKRLEKLEEVAKSFAGVDMAYAIQAGREVRVIVNAERVPDAEAAKVARDIAIEIEKELSYPGEIKVTLIRETRIVEYAR